jgi:alkaline phosphatase
MITVKSNNQLGINRRDALKILGTGAGAGALSTILPDMAQAKGAGDFFPMASGRGLIFLVGDGMPLGVIRAMHEIVTRGYGRPGSNMYSLMKNPQTVASYMGTASLSSIVTDSAPASAAWSTGVHTNNGVLAALPDGTPLKTIMELLKQRGLSTGLVTTTRVTHATPAAWVSHNTNRDDEYNIAQDFFDFMPDVLMGGGGKYFDKAYRPDQQDLFGNFAEAGYSVLRNKTDLDQYAASMGRDSKVLGIFNSSHMSYYLDRLNTPETQEPDLAAMTAVALKNLSRNHRGFILQVEAGRIDHASHANDAWGAIVDMIEMDNTLAVILQYIKRNPETLLIITSDHGNSGWGVNGTGPSYNDATIALMNYQPITASLEKIAPMLKNKGIYDIAEIVKKYTTFEITPAEAQMIYDSLQPGFKHYPGDFNYLAETVLGKILAHSDYSANIRRGNVGFTSNNHTAEDQIALIYGRAAHMLQVPAYIDNTDLFQIMCDYFNLRFINPMMDAKTAKSFIRKMSQEAWQHHMHLHCY